MNARADAAASRARRTAASVAAAADAAAASYGEEDFTGATPAFGSAGGPRAFFPAVAGAVAAFDTDAAVDDGVLLLLIMSGEDVVDDGKDCDGRCWWF